MIGVSVVPMDSNLIELLASMENIGSGADLVNTNEALNQVSNMIARQWGDKVGRDTQGRSKIQIDKSSPTSRKVYSRDKLVHWLEVGLPGYDMRQTHTKGKKSRVVKPRIGPGGKIITQWKVKNPDGSHRTVMAGSSYLIIPFFHKWKHGKGTESNKKLADYRYSIGKQMKTEGFQRSSIVTSAEDSSKVSPNYWGEKIKRAEYSWGSKVKFPDTPENANLQGMVAMDQSTKKKKQTGFMTFRVVSVNSPAGSWWHPGIKARHHLENIVNEGKEVITQVIQDGLKRDFG